MPGARGSSTCNMGAVYPPFPAYSRPKLRMFRAGSWLPGQFGLVHCLATEMFQEVGIDLVCDSRFRIPGAGFPRPKRGLTEPAGMAARARVGRGAAGRAVRRADHLRSSYLRNF